MSKKFWLSGKGVPSPPILKKIFFADLHDLGYERKKNKKKCENDPNFSGHTPPPHPKCEISHFFFDWEPGIQLFYSAFAPPGQNIGLIIFDSIHFLTSEVWTYHDSP